MPMTGTLTTTPVEDWKREGVAHGARAMFVVRDDFPWPPEPYPVYTSPSENIVQRFSEFDGVNMQRVTAVHLLSQN